MTDDQRQVSSVDYWTSKLDGALAPIALFAVSRVLVVPPSTASVECAFSVASDVQQSNRFRLGQKGTECEMIIRLNSEFVQI